MADPVAVIAPQSSSVISTTAAAMTMPQIAGAIIWINMGCPQPMPENVALAFAAGSLPLIHLLYKAIVVLFAKHGVNGIVVPTVPVLPIATPPQGSPPS